MMKNRKIQSGVLHQHFAALKQTNYYNCDFTIKVFYQ